MTYENIDLFFGCFGNGVIVCNRAEEKNNDYKKLAYIADCGKITWYVEPSCIPETELIRIKEMAEKEAEKWEKMLSDRSLAWQYEYLLERVPDSVFRHVIHMDDDMTKKIEYLKCVLQEKSTWA